MAKNLRSFIAGLEERQPGEFRRVRKLVNGGAYEASALMEVLERNEQYPAVLFENLVDLKGWPSNHRLMMNAFSTVSKMSEALNAPLNRRAAMEQYNRGVQNPQPVNLVSGERAPIMEMVSEGEQVDLFQLPIPRINEMDGGPYLTPIIVAKDPDNGRYNISWNRAMLIDKNHLGLWMSPRHLWSLFARVEKNGNLPIAIVLGHHPAFFLTGAGLTKLDHDEYEVAGGVMGESLPVTPSVSFGKQLLIPAEAEIVLEGELVADRRTVEGPFGEFTGYSGPQRLSWLVKIKAVCARRDGIILNIFGGHQENLYAHLPIQADIFANLRSIVPNVLDVNWIESGGPLHLIIQMDKKVEGEPVRAAMAAMSLSNFIKHVIVVDKDIDPGNLKQVMWAVATRVQADKDVNIISGTQGQVLDPSLIEEILGSAMIIDATKPVGQPYAIKAQPPEASVQKVNLEDYFA